jgi:hypothetical protein
MQRITPYLKCAQLKTCCHTFWTSPSCRVLLLRHGIDYLGALDASGALDGLGLLYPVENGA